MLHIRRAVALDSRQMAEILNEIIAIGGTTALVNPVTADTLTEWMVSDPRSLWHVAEDEGGAILGFQWVDPHPKEGPKVAQIATFAKAGRTGLGIGSALFKATQAACVDAGYVWINAEIRADNMSGLAYYQSRGFEDYGRINGYRMQNGQVVDKVLKRFDL